MSNGRRRPHAENESLAKNITDEVIKAIKQTLFEGVK